MTLQIIWFVLLVVLFAGYSVLDGFDLGIGILSPFIARSEIDKRILFNAIGPFWDGNEVWLVTAGGALFAAFPPVYATVFSGLYLPLMLVLFALIFRAVALEFRLHEPHRKRTWEWAFCIGSALPSFLYGVALGNLMIGIPLDVDLNYAGGILTLLRPYPLLIGILSILLILMQGAAYGTMRTRGELRLRLKKVLKGTRYLVIIVMTIAVGFGAFLIPGAVYRFVPWLFVAVTMAAWAGGRVSLNRDRDGMGFAFSSLMIIGLWGVLATAQYPYLVRASNFPNRGMTLQNASSSPLTLKVMLIIAALGMPLVLLYTIWVYRAFRGRVILPAMGKNGE